MTTKKKMGRPKLAASDAKSERLQVRLTKTELEMVEAKAEADGLTVSDWARSIILGSRQVALKVP